MQSMHQLRVEKFMIQGGQDVPAMPSIPSEEVRILRAKLILEEALETIEGLGVRIDAQDNCGVSVEDLDFVPVGEFSFEKTIDGCCDLKVVATGTLSAMGIPDEVFQQEVDNNNLMKVSGKITRDANGKILKPAGYTPPKIREILIAIKTRFIDGLGM